MRPGADATHSLLGCHGRVVAQSQFSDGEFHLALLTYMYGPQIRVYCI